MASTDFVSNKQVEIVSWKAINSKHFVLCQLSQFKAICVCLALISIFDRVLAQQDLKILASIVSTPASSSLSSKRKIQA